MVNLNQPIIRNNDTQIVVKGKIKWGQNVTFGPNCKNISIGYGCFIGNDIYIDVEYLDIGDYFTIHHGSIIHGKKCTIGHNCWIGHYTILDSLGGELTIGNNVGVGAHSQLWSHMKFGDVLAGCRWNKTGNLTIGDDAWLVGHCIVASITVEPRSMLLVGGVAVREMKENHIYAGSPAKDVTNKMGSQFEEISLEKKQILFNRYLSEYKSIGNDVGFVKVVEIFSLNDNQNYTQFNLLTREYLPRYHEDEYKFMRFLLYDKAKFIPLIAKK